MLGHNGGAQICGFCCKRRAATAAAARGHADAEGAVLGYGGPLWSGPPSPGQQQHAAGHVCGAAAWEAAGNNEPWPSAGAQPWAGAAAQRLTGLHGDLS